MSETTTRGIRIQVVPEFLPQQSDPESGRFLFAYHIEIENTSQHTVKLLSRYWLITDGESHQEEVSGDGVVGLQPTLAPGERFSYSSGCPLPTRVGTMEGHYLMSTADGDTFQARIDPFTLAAPGSLH